MNLNSNFLLIGLILVSITCIYLLYVNINRSNETDSIKQNIKVLISQNKKRDEILNYVIDKLDSLNTTVTTNQPHTTNTVSTTNHVYHEQEQEYTQDQLSKREQPQEQEQTQDISVTEEQEQLENELYDVETFYTTDLQKEEPSTEETEENYEELLSSMNNNVNLGNDVYADENNNFVRMSSSSENELTQEDVQQALQQDDTHTQETTNDISSLNLEDINLNELDIENEFTELLNNGDSNGFANVDEPEVAVDEPTVVNTEPEVAVAEHEVAVAEPEVAVTEPEPEPTNNTTTEEDTLEAKLQTILNEENISLNASENESEDEDVYSLPRNVSVLKNKYSADKLKHFAKTLNVKQTGTKKEIAERIINELNSSSQ
jgi:hypothetical protein